MTDQPESIPYEDLTAELERALLEQVRRNVVLEARIRVRDRTIEAQNGQISRLMGAVRDSVGGQGVALAQPPAQDQIHDHRPLDQPGPAAEPDGDQQPGS